MSSASSNRQSQSATNVNNSTRSNSSAATGAMSTSASNSTANAASSSSAAAAVAAAAAAAAVASSSPFNTSLLNGFGSLLNIASLASAAQHTPAAVSPSTYASQLMLDPVLLALATSSMQNQTSRQPPATATTSPFAASVPSNPFSAMLTNANPFSMMLPQFLSGSASLNSLQHALPCASSSAAVGSSSNSNAASSSASASTSASASAAAGLELFKVFSEQARLLSSLSQLQSTNNSAPKPQAAPVPNAASSAAAFLNLAASMSSAPAPAPAPASSSLSSAQVQSAMSVLASALQSLSSQSQSQNQNQNQNQNQSQSQSQPSRPNDSNASHSSHSRTAATGLDFTAAEREVKPADQLRVTTTANAASSKSHVSPRSVSTSSKSAANKTNGQTAAAKSNSDANAQKRITDFSIHNLVNSSANTSGSELILNSTPPAAHPKPKAKPSTALPTGQPPKAHSHGQSSRSVPNNSSSTRNQPTGNSAKKSSGHSPASTSASAPAPAQPLTLPTGVNVPEPYLKPFELGWRRETRLKPAANKTVFGEVAYLPPAASASTSQTASGSKRITTQRELIRFLQQAKDPRIKKNNFCFNPKTIFGAYLIWNADTKSYREMTHNDLQKLCDMVESGRKCNTEQGANSQSTTTKSTAKKTAANRSRPPKKTATSSRAGQSAKSKRNASDATADAEADAVAVAAAAADPVEAAETTTANAPTEGGTTAAKKRRPRPRPKAKKTADQGDAVAEKNTSLASDLTVSPDDAARNNCSSTSEPPVGVATDETGKAAGKPDTATDTPAIAAKSAAAGGTRTSRSSRRDSRRKLLRNSAAEQANANQAWTREVKRAFDDLLLDDSKELPNMERVVGNRLTGNMFAECLTLVEFLNTFGKCLGFDRSTLPTMLIFQRAFCDAEGGCKQYVVHLACALVKVAINDPVYSHIKQFATKSGDRLGDEEVNDGTLPKILRVFMRSLLARDAVFKAKIKKSRKFSDFDAETQCKCLAFMRDELLGGRYVSNEIDRIIVQQGQLRKDKWAVDSQLRRARLIMNQKFVGNASRSTTPANASSSTPEVNEEPTAKASAVAVAVEQSLPKSQSDREPELEQMQVESELQDAENDVKEDGNGTQTPVAAEVDGEHGTKLDSDSDKPSEKLINEITMMDAADDVRNRLRRTAARSARRAEENAVVAGDKKSLELTPDAATPPPVTPPPLLEAPIAAKECEESESELGSNFLLTLSASEDEFANLSKEELQKLIKKLEAKEREKQNHGLHLQRLLRGLHLGNDRFYRNYWVLSAAGGVLVESIESADFDADEYMRKLESALAKRDSSSSSSSSDDSDDESRSSELAALDSTSQVAAIENGVASKYEAMENGGDSNNDSKTGHLESTPVALVPNGSISPVRKTETDDVIKTETRSDMDLCNGKVESEPAEGCKPESCTPAGEGKLDSIPVVSVNDEAEKPSCSSTMASRSRIPEEHRVGWWCISDPADVQSLCRNLNTHGLREKILHRNFTRLNDSVTRGIELAKTSNVFSYDATHLPARPRVRAAKPRSSKKSGNASSRKNVKEASPTTNGVSATNGGALATEKPTDSRKSGEAERSSKSRNASRRNGSSQPENGRKLQESARRGGLDDVLMNITQQHEDSASESESNADACSVLQSDCESASGSNKSGSDAPARSRSPLLSARANARTVSQIVKVLSKIEEIEERVFSASLQSKGWSLPCKMAAHDRVKRARRDFKRAAEQNSMVKQAQAIDQLIEIAKRRLLSLEQHVERRYLKAPFTNTTHLRKAIRRAIRSGIERSRQVTPKRSRNQKPFTDDRMDSTDSSSESAWSCEGLDESPPRSPVLSVCDESEVRARVVGGHEETSNLLAWRVQVQQAFSVDELRAPLHRLEESIEWEKSIMKVMCAICRLDNNEAELLLCDGCDQGYHTYCFKPTMQTVPQGEFYCWNCVAYATNRPRCFVCGLRSSEDSNRLITCAICSHAAHATCVKIDVPASEWLCLTCTTDVAVRGADRDDQQPATCATSKHDCISDGSQRRSDAKLHRSSSKIARSSSSVDTDADDDENALSKTNDGVSAIAKKKTKSASDVKGRDRKRKQASSDECLRSKPDCSNDGESVATSKCDSETLDVTAKRSRKQCERDDDEKSDGRDDDLNKHEQDDKQVRKQALDDVAQAICSTMLDELKKHEKSWPFHKRVNTKQFPMYKKIIKQPMDIGTVAAKLRKHDYNSQKDFAADLRLMFSNCEIFNEDDSDIGRAGHALRQFFEARWSQLCESIPESGTSLTENGKSPDSDNDFTANT